MNLFISILFFLVFWAGDFFSPTHLTSPDFFSPTNDSLMLEAFDESKIPPRELDGCICLFYSSEADRKSKKCLVAQGIDGSVGSVTYIIFISIKGKLEKLHFIHSGVTGVERYVDQNGVYVVDIYDVSRKQVGYESFYVKGKIRVSSLYGKFSCLFIGDCGC